MGAGERERLENGDQGTEVKIGEGPREGGVRSILEFLPGLPRSPFTRKKEGLSQRSLYIFFFYSLISQKGFLRGEKPPVFNELQKFKDSF